MKIIHKVTSAALTLSLLFVCNFCLVECAFASEEHNHSAPVKNSTEHCRESSQNQEQSNSEKHDAATLCCPSLAAIQNAQSYTNGITFAKDSFFKTVVLERFIPRPNTRPEYEVEFPPGASPPAVFLLNHFTHAPPVSF